MAVMQKMKHKESFGSKLGHGLYNFGSKVKRYSGTAGGVATAVGGLVGLAGAATGNPALIARGAQIGLAGQGLGYVSRIGEHTMSLGKARANKSNTDYADPSMSFRKSNLEKKKRK